LVGQKGIAFLKASRLKGSARGELIGARVVALQVCLPIALIIIIEKNRLGDYQLLAFHLMLRATISLVNIPVTDTFT